MVKKICIRTALVIFIIVFYLFVFLTGAVCIVFKGNFPAAKELVTVTMMETSAAKFIPKLFLGDAAVAEILANNTIDETVESVDRDLIKIPQNAKQAAENPQEVRQKEVKEIELVEVAGSTFKGRMLIIKDPKRLYIATPEAFGSESGGVRVEDMVKRDNAVAGVNGGGFLDVNGMGDGGTPMGYVIKGGSLVFGGESDVAAVVGFDGEGKLIVGYMSAADALKRGVVEGLTFSPVGPLIINGEALDVKGTGGGLNPRTAIGQRADGSILLLCIDGRQAHSLGASFKDLIGIFTEYGAVNAANLDGGSSSVMIYEGKAVSVTASIYGSRKLPTAILVK